MSSNNTHEMTERLRNLSVQCTYAEEALDTINQEANLVEYHLRVARSAVRRDMDTTNTTVNKNKIFSVLETFSAS